MNGTTPKHKHLEPSGYERQLIKMMKQPSLENAGKRLLCRCIKRIRQFVSHDHTTSYHLAHQNSVAWNTLNNIQLRTGSIQRGNQQQPIGNVIIINQH